MLERFFKTDSTPRRLRNGPAGPFLKRYDRRPIVFGCEPSGTAVMRCGGDRPGFTPVTSGLVNEFFEATSPQVVKIKPGVKVETGTKDRESTLTVIAMDGKKGDYTCSCGAAPCNGSCALVMTEPLATCTGDCTAPNACCIGCRLWKN